MESVGISTDDSNISFYDEIMVSKFKNGIGFKDGKYRATFLWHEDLIEYHQILIF